MSEFRAPVVAAQRNGDAIEYLTGRLADPIAGRAVVNELIAELGSVIQQYPDWHPILVLPQTPSQKPFNSLRDVPAYSGADHTVKFISGFVTCPYSVKEANNIVRAANKIPWIRAYRIGEPLYSDKAYPVVVVADNIVLEADGTIRSKDAIAWFVQHLARIISSSEVAETWWSIRSSILGTPHGSRSSLFVNQYCGNNMRKILEVLNESGVFGPILEYSLDMLSKKKRDAIGYTLISSALKAWDKENMEFTFELRGETCRAFIRDTWDDGMEFSLRVNIGDNALSVNGWYYPDKDKIETMDPIGHLMLAKKFC